MIDEILECIRDLQIFIKIDVKDIYYCFQI